jgi:Mrp family chromosome partitioning ATPase
MRELVTKWRREYDFVIIDSPPVLPVTDAILLSQVADASLLIVRHGVTPRDTVQRSYRLLRQQLPNQAVLGLVMNAMPEGATRYYAYYGSEEADLKVERVRENVAS